MEKLTRMGFLFFTIVLFFFSALKYLSGNGKTAVYYFVGAIGFFIVYLSYKKKS